jgi:hypothetical protein
MLKEVYIERSKNDYLNFHLSLNYLDMKIRGLLWNNWASPDYTHPYARSKKLNTYISDWYIDRSNLSTSLKT